MYLDTIRRLRHEVRRKRPKIWRTISCFLLHDIAPAYRSVLVKDFLTKNNVTKPKHPPHSPDLAPAEYYFFPRLKSALKRRCFFYASDIIKNAAEELQKILQNGF